MAIVRFSRELRTSILNNANKLFTTRVTAVRERPVPAPWSGDVLYDTMFAPWRVHMDALPREFFYQYNVIGIRQVGKLLLRNTFLLSTQRPFPSGFPDSRFVIRSGYGGTNEFDLKDQPDSPYSSLIEHYKQIHTEVEAIEVQRHNFTAGVDKVLDAHTTLAPALKVWPALWDLLPEEVKDKHRLVVNKASADKPRLEGVDVASLTATVVMSKLGV
jgi:hypothetical protein